MELSLITSHLDFGGAQRITINLANELSRRGHRVDLLAVDANGGLKPEVNGDVNIIDLDSTGSHYALPSLIFYLRNNKPDLLFSSLTQVNVLSTVAATIARVETDVIITEHSVPRERTSTGEKTRSLQLAEYVYPYADKIIAVSNDIADGISDILNIPRTQISVIPNPVIEPSIRDKYKQKCEDISFEEHQYTILGAGRIEPRKDFKTLIQAHKYLSSTHDIHTIILGDGPDIDDLKRIADENDLEDTVTFPGYVENPYKYMNRASVFALSSITEGFPSVLVEAMACGTPVVATDCSSGVHEILDGGKYGTIVPIEDPEKLAEGIKQEIESPLESNVLKSRANRYSSENIANNYEEMFESIIR